MPAHGQCIWHPFCVTAGACEGQEIRSQPRAKPAEKRDSVPTEPCFRFSDSSLKARYSEHKILGETHCFVLVSKQNSFAKYFLTRSSFALPRPTCLWGKRTAIRLIHQAKPSVISQLFVNKDIRFKQFLSQSSPKLERSKLERPNYYLLHFADNC